MQRIEQAGDMPLELGSVARVGINRIGMMAEMLGRQSARFSFAHLGEVTCGIPRPWRAELGRDAPVVDAASKERREKQHCGRIVVVWSKPIFMQPSRVAIILTMDVAEAPASNELVVAVLAAGALADPVQSNGRAARARKRRFEALGH